MIVKKFKIYELYVPEELGTIDATWGNELNPSPIYNRYQRDCLVLLEIDSPSCNSSFETEEEAMNVLNSVGKPSTSYTILPFYYKE